ncbi:MAG: hypothetical protein KAS12_02185 [Candidatus Aenigmarchaeota archaeon]|nr:hypothetical protein [Candidatus Aenigmarchaeota archaeon]
MALNFKELIKKRKNIHRVVEGKKPEFSPGQSKTETRVEKERPWEQPLKEEETPQITITPPSTKKTVLPEVKPIIKSTTRQQIESILSDGLDNLYLSLSKDEQIRFKEKGEETASKIEKIIKSAKINFKKIVDLIKKWLATIPGVNRFFLEQEAKIKTDKIINLSDQKNK